MAARRPAKGPVVKATEAELKTLGVDVAKSGIAAAALELARVLDGSIARAAERASCARAHREAIDRLRELAPPPKQEKTQRDELAAQRAARRRRAVAANPPSS